MGGNLRVAWFIMFQLYSSTPMDFTSPSMHSVCWGLAPVTYPEEFPTIFCSPKFRWWFPLKKQELPCTFLMPGFFMFPWFSPWILWLPTFGPSQGGYLPSHRAARLQRVVRLVASSGAFAALTEGVWAAWSFSFRWVKHTRSDVFQMGYFHNLPRDLSEHLIFQASC